MTNCNKNKIATDGKKSFPALNQLSVFRMVFYKERLKLNRLWLTLLFFNLVALAYFYIETRHLFKMDHAEIVWYRVIGLGQIHYEMWRYLPCLTAIALSVFQFLPEMKDERLRLSLHLPVQPHLVIWAHLFAGSLIFGLMEASVLAALALITGAYFPVETVHSTILTCLPWFIGGWCAYIGTALFFLEPSLKLKIFNIFLSLGLVGPLLGKALPGAFAGSLLVCLLPPLLLMLSVLLPAYHFRHRKCL